jgi:hypothetical protein
MKRFTDNQDGTILDSKTGLTWLKDANYFGRTMDWNEAMQECKALALAGGFWRLPERVELESLLDLTQYNPTLTLDHSFTNVQSIYYWSATPVAYYTSYAWIVSMFYGYVHDGSKASSRYYVWPVRGGRKAK